MKTITMYELLGMVKDGKELPKKVKYEKHIYEYEEGTYDWSYYIQNNGTIKFLLTDVFNSNDNILNILNYEVEILEEEKKIPEKLEEYADVSGDLACQWTFGEKKLKDKTNEIIDYLEYIKSKGE